MAKRKRSASRKAKSIPVAPLIPIAAVTMNALAYNGTYAQKLNHLSIHALGYDIEKGSFEAASAAPFWVGEGVGIVVHKVSNKVGLNNFIRQMSMGYLSL